DTSGIWMTAPGNVGDPVPLSGQALIASLAQIGLRIKEPGVQSDHNLPKDFDLQINIGAR
ncbi:MAG: hypothetical protein WBS22_09135, partial [Methylocystis sp.]